MTRLTTIAATAAPAKFAIWIFRGVAPSQYPILNSVTSVAVVESAVQTTPPMRSAASIPWGPVSPARTMTTEATTRVMSVMPEIGVTPIMATARAETLAKRNEMMTVTASAMKLRDVALASPLRTEKRK